VKDLIQHLESKRELLRMIGNCAAPAAGRASEAFKRDQEAELRGFDKALVYVRGFGTSTEPQESL